MPPGAYENVLRLSVFRQKAVAKALRGNEYDNSEISFAFTVHSSLWFRLPLGCLFKFSLIGTKHATVHHPPRVANQETSHDFYFSISAFRNRFSDDGDWTIWVNGLATRPKRSRNKFQGSFAIRCAVFRTAHFFCLPTKSHHPLWRALGRARLREEPCSGLANGF